MDCGRGTMNKQEQSVRHMYRDGERHTGMEGETQQGREKRREGEGERRTRRQRDSEGYLMDGGWMDGWIKSER